MLGMINPFSGGRNTGQLVLWIISFTLILGVALLGTGQGGVLYSAFGTAAPVDKLGRPALSSHMPKPMPGWHKRAFLPSDGEVIAGGARGRGLDARLAMGEDIEQFTFYSKGELNSTAAVYVDGDKAIAIGLKRGLMKIPPWLERSAYSSADWAKKVDGLHKGEIIAIIHGLAFERRRPGAESPDGFGYDRYVARIGKDLVVDVISNAPQIDVEQLLARLDGAALKSQLPEDSPAIDATLGLVLHHQPETWPERLDLTGQHKLSDWIADAE